MKRSIAYSNWMANRLGAGRARTGAIIAVAGVACALAIMLMTWGISRGFNTQIKQRLKGFEPEIKISAPYSYLSGNSKEFIRYTPDLQSSIIDIVPQASATITFRQPTIIKTDDNFEAVILCAYDKNRDRSFETSNIIDGRMPDFNSADGDTAIVLSQKTANKLSLKIGDRITTCFFIKDAIRSRRYTLTGIYDSGFTEFDANIAYGSLHTLQKLNRVDSLAGTSIEINNVRIQLDSLPDIAKRLQETLIIKANAEGRGEVEVVDNITNTGAIYLNWLSLIETNVVVIFAIMCIVAALTLVSSLFIIILDRISTIGLMRALGANKSQVRDTFTFIAMRLVLLGMLIGNIIALGFAYLQDKYAFIKLNPEMYYIDSVPFDIDIITIILINLGVIVISWLTLVIPSRIAAGISPTQTIRFE